MNNGTWDRVAGNWKQFTGKAKQNWAEFTDDELLAVEGKREELVGKIQDKYGKTKMEAEQEVDDWVATL